MTELENLTDLARRVQQAYDESGEAGQRCLQDIFADQLEVRHTPPAPFDGVVERGFLIEHQDTGYAAARAAFRDLRLEGKVTVEEGRLVVTKTFSGTKDDGSAVRSVSRAAYQVEGGRIVGADSTGTRVEGDLRRAGAHLE